MKKRTRLALLIFGLGIIATLLLSACAKEPEESNNAPDFTLQTVDGTVINLADFKNKPVMLTFWRIDCPACQYQMPFTEEVFNKWSSDSVVILTINVGDRAADVKEYIDSHQIHYPILLDTRGRVSASYGLIGVPTTFFIDGAGILQAYHVGAFDSAGAMENAINSAFPSIVLNPKTPTSPPIINPPGVESGPEVGKAAPDFNLKDINDQSRSLSQYRGKAVLLNFWMSSCDACVAELPYLQTASDNLTDEPVAIIAVNCGESSMAVHSVVDKMDLSYPVLIDPDGIICQTYKRGAPTAFLIDSTGIIKAIKDDAFENPTEVIVLIDSLSTETQ